MEGVEGLDNKINYHEQCADELNEKKEAMRRKIIETKIKRLFDSNVLAQAKWDLIVSTGSYLRIHCKGKSEQKLIGLIIAPGYGHESIELQPGVTLQFDDGEVDIIFVSPAACREFIKEHQITVSVEKYEKQIEELQARILIIKEMMGVIKEQ